MSKTKEHPAAKNAKKVPLPTKAPVKVPVKAAAKSATSAVKLSPAKSSKSVPVKGTKPTASKLVPAVATGLVKAAVKLPAKLVKAAEKSTTKIIRQVVVTPPKQSVAKPTPKSTPHAAVAAVKVTSKPIAKQAAAKAAPAKFSPAAAKPVAKPAAVKPAAVKPVVAAKSSSAVSKPAAKPVVTVMPTVAAKAAVPANPAPTKGAAVRSSAPVVISAAPVGKSTPAKGSGSGVAPKLAPVAVKAVPVVEKLDKPAKLTTASVNAFKVVKMPKQTAELSSKAQAAANALLKSPFSPEEIGQWRAVLIERRHEISSDIGALEKDAMEAEDGHTTPLHAAERGSDADLQDVSLGLAGEEKDLLWQVDRALRKIDVGLPLAFGLCEYTKEAIPKLRLQLIPWTPLSIEGAIHLEENNMTLEDLLLED